MVYPAAPASRHIALNVAKAAKPLDRFFDLSVGSDYPGTLIRDDCQAQLRRPSTNSASDAPIKSPDAVTVLGRSWRAP
jgi:hypothetical protein